MKKSNTQQITLGGVDFSVCFQCPVTSFLYFREFGGQKGLLNCPETISLTKEEIQREQEDFGSEAFTEFNLLLDRFSGLLLRYGRCLFHGVAISVRDQAWLLTAPSGTGKSTQYLHWKRLYGEEVHLICGDKPVLEFQDSGDILVHPSPWVGKERWNAQSGPAKLAGIVYLEQGKKNSIGLLPAAKAVVPLYTQFLHQARDTAQLRQLSAMLDRMLRSVPVWKLVNVGDEDSARLTYETIFTK